MAWIDTFYQKQTEWFGIYLGDLDETHHERAELCQNYIQSPRKVLELGAGGGQTAIALAQLYDCPVTMVEILEVSCQQAVSLIDFYKVPVSVIEGNFYKIKLHETYDLICYFDSFGIGDDTEQKALLNRIASWLSPSGIALIEIGNPLFWSNTAHNKKMDLGACIRHCQFDFGTSRLIDRWWRHEYPDEIIYQSLRCYKPDELEALLSDTELSLKHIHPGGTINFEKMEFYNDADLIDCSTYYVILQKKQ